MFWALIRYRQGVVNALTGFALTVAGSMYIGWSMVHYIGIRALPDGLFWTPSVVLSVWLADTGAYLVGRRIGAHRDEGRQPQKDGRVLYRALPSQ